MENNYHYLYNVYYMGDVNTTQYYWTSAITKLADDKY